MPKCKCGSGKDGTYYNGSYVCTDCIDKALTDGRIHYKKRPHILPDDAACECGSKTSLTYAEDRYWCGCCLAMEVKRLRVVARAARTALDICSVGMVGLVRDGVGSQSFRADADQFAAAWRDLGESLDAAGFARAKEATDGNV